VSERDATTQFFCIYGTILKLPIVSTEIVIPAEAGIQPITTIYFAMLLAPYQPHILTFLELILPDPDRIFLSLVY